MNITSQADLQKKLLTLPKYAQEYIHNLEAEVERKTKEIEELTHGDGSETGIWYEDLLVKHGLPVHSRVKFAVRAGGLLTDLEVSRRSIINKDTDTLTIRCTMGSLSIMPTSSNSVEVRVTRI